MIDQLYDKVGGLLLNILSKMPNSFYAILAFILFSIILWALIFGIFITLYVIHPILFCAGVILTVLFVCYRKILTNNKI